MATLVIKSLPEDLHDRLRHLAAAHRRSVTQETIFLLESALRLDSGTLPAPADDAEPTTSHSSYWKHREILPEYEALLKSGALQGGTDSTAMISEERDSR